MKKLLKWAGIGFLILIGLGALSSIGKNATQRVGTTTSNQVQTKNTTNDTQQVQPTASEAPLVVDATSMVKEYDTNKLAAQDKYTGKTVQTTAIIDNISQDVVGSYFLSLKPTSDQYYFGTSMKCTFPDKGTLTSLAKGQSVTIQGQMEDLSIGIISMKNCSLVN